jgi:molecular chaperone DnaK
MSDIIVGIDLGTTNSEIAWVRDGRPEVIAYEGEVIMP